jgi:hypothetical protein
VATLSATNPTYLDVAKRLDPDGSIAAIVEIVSERNAVMKDAVVMEGNLTTGNRSTQRTGLPTATWRLLNQGVPNSKSTTVQVDDQCGMLEAYAEVDLKLANMANNKAAFVASEDAAFLESMSQTMEDTFFSGNTATNPERFLGLAPRYSATSATKTNIGYNVIKEGSHNGNDSTSVYLINWSPRTTFLMFPKGSQGGFKRTFLGQQTLSDANGQYEGLRTHYSWDVGLTVRDWRSNVRVQFDSSQIASGSPADLDAGLTRAINRQRATGGRDVFYMNEATHNALEHRAASKDNVHLSFGEAFGGKVMTYRGIPIRVTDAITNAETAL